MKRDIIVVVAGLALANLAYAQQCVPLTPEIDVGAGAAAIALLAGAALILRARGKKRG